MLLDLHWFLFSDSFITSMHVKAESDEDSYLSSHELILTKVVENVMYGKISL